MTDAHSQPTQAGPEGLDDDELDRVESELTRAERTLALLADDDIDPSAAAEWLTEPADPAIPTRGGPERQQRSM